MLRDKSLRKLGTSSLVVGSLVIASDVGDILRALT